ncbi:MAG: intradiol ring-cleavage dioxygenase [Proteobacteria bacterium]|nr:intradiol ring-cleavage dioxygenase [Pseudomonadota bacterium]
MPSDKPFDRRQFLSTAVLSATTALGVAGWAGRGHAATECKAAVATDSGPFFPPGTIPELSDLVSLPGRTGRARGQVLHLAGTVRDSACRPLSDVLVTIWQADANGLYKHPRGGDQNTLDDNFGYFAAQRTDRDGRYRFRTIAPNSYKFAGITRSPHIHFKLAHRDHRALVTELYFAGRRDDELREIDRVFRSRPARSRDRLIMAKTPVSGPLAQSDPGALACVFDVQLARRARSGGR